MQAVVDRVAKRDKKPETKELVDDWAARLSGKEAELAEERATAAAKAEVTAAAIKAEPDAEGAAGPADEATAAGIAAFVVDALCFVFFIMVGAMCCRSKST